jgi:hypothetical protein
MTESTTGKSSASFASISRAMRATAACDLVGRADDVGLVAQALGVAPVMVFNLRCFAPRASTVARYSRKSLGDFGCLSA